MREKLKSISCKRYPNQNEELKPLREASLGLAQLYSKKAGQEPSLNSEPTYFLNHIKQISASDKIVDSIESGQSIAYRPIPPRPVQKHYELSSAQQRLWFLDKFEPENSFESIPWGFRLKGKLNRKLFQQALEQIVTRHEVLRTSFQEVEGTPVQVVHSNVEAGKPKPLYGYQYIDLSREKDPEAKAKERLVQEDHRPFDLTQDPMLRCEVIKVGQNVYDVLLNIHHIAADTWSTHLIASELSEHYTALVQGRPPQVPNLPIQYKDFAHWQNELFKSEAFKKQEHYWLKQLGGELPVLKLPLDKPRPAVQSYEGAFVKEAFDPGLMQKLESFSQAQKTTLFVTLITAFKVWLWKLAGQEDLIVGTPIVGRNHPDLENLIGSFANHLSLRTQIKGEAKFTDLLAQVKQTSLRALDNQDYPFEHLVEQLNPERDPSHHPIFSTTFVLNRLEHEAIGKLGDVQSVPLDLDFHISELDFTLHVNKFKDRSELALQYNTDLFEKVSVKRFLAYYQTILQEIAKNPKQQLKDIEILSKEEKHQLLVEFNDTKAEYPKDKCIHELFEEQVERTPDNIAVVFQDQKLTYRELNERANQLAHYLRNQGVKTESLVGLMVERSVGMLVGILGILKAGGAYVPIDPSYPKQRVEHILDSSQCAWILSQEKWTAQLKPFSAKPIIFEKISPALEQASSQNPKAPSPPTSLAYVIYTSGSTGLPKGVMIEHRNLVNFIDSMKGILSPEENSKLVGLTTLSFDIFGLELYGALSHGMTLLLIDDETQQNLPQLAQQLKQHQVSHLQITPTILNSLLEQSENTEFLSSLQKLLVGGRKSPQTAR